MTTLLPRASHALHPTSHVNEKQKHVLVKLTLHGQNATGTYLCQLVHIASSNLDPLSLYN